MIYAVLNRTSLTCIGSYQAVRVTIKNPYTDIINEIHHEVEEGKYPDGYYLLIDGTVLYDQSYAPPSQPYAVVTKSKLIDYTEAIAELSLDFASENSEIMYNLSYDIAQKQAAVRTVVDAFKEIETELRMFSYYDVFTMLDNITRSEPLLTDSRINSYKASLAGILA